MHNYKFENLATGEVIIIEANNLADAMDFARNEDTEFDFVGTVD